MTEAKMYLEPTPPALSEEPEKQPASQLIFKGLLRDGMKPVQALVFMGFYKQFPARYIPGNEYYFKPTVRLIISPMRIKEPVYWLMVTRLVDGGWLERRKARSGGLEFRIVFEKLHGYIESKEGKA